MPTISVLIPCYNAEKYLSKAIESVLGQTYDDFELLVLIDGSSDNSKKIAEDFAKNDKRIKIFEKPNSGVSDTRNYGLKKAKGEFVYFMDSDDWIEPQLLEENLKILDSENLDLIVFGYIQDDENTIGDLIASKEVAPRLTQLSKGDLKNRLDPYHIGLLGYVWNKIYRKEFLLDNNINFPVGISWGEDFLFNAPVFMSSNKIYFNSGCYYHYLSRPTLSLAKSFQDNLFELIIKKNEVLEQLLLDWSVNNKKELLSTTLFSGFKYCLLNLNESSLNQAKKTAYLKYMCSHPKSEELFKNFVPQAYKDKLLLILIRSKNMKLINFLRKVK
ncbi:glycosyltransferase family 2 protein [Aequorivita capsosiphonis]|uniref:glycosyltransferase family 2 protein n=1 Tax=Aequorivita capsosiphonis TaxID=487317 RepID=UPI00041F1E1E|nr:glycosyltransferase family 2 protein [Aequorivita capsosiphonis]